MGTKNLARLYVEVCKDDKIDRNGGQPSTCFCTFPLTYIIPGVVPTLVKSNNQNHTETKRNIQFLKNTPQWDG